MFVKAKRLPSALNPIHVITGDAGSVTLRSLPSAITFSVRLRYRWPRCGALVLGLIRTPASR